MATTSGRRPLPAAGQTADVGGLLYLRLEGPPRERGHVQGEALRPAIAQGMTRWKDVLGRATHLRPHDYLDRFLAATNFLPAIERWTPDLLDEVRGIGEGAGIPFRDIFAYQLMDEEWLFRTAVPREGAGQSSEHCSMLGVFGEGEAPILAQNMDLPRYYDGTQTLLHILEGHGEAAVESLVFTAAGLIGTLGLNSRAVGICVNTLAQLDHARHGLPVAFITRRLIASPTQRDAFAFVRRVDHASGQNYAIGGPEAIVDVECSARAAVPFAPHPTRVYHTNHPLVHPDQPASRHWRDGQGSVAPAGGEAGPETRIASNSEQRFALLDQHVGRNPEHLTVAKVMSILATREVPISVPRGGAGDSMTLGSLIMELTVPPVLHIAPGPPAETAYTRWTL